MPYRQAKRLSITLGWITAVENAKSGYIALKDSTQNVSSTTRCSHEMAATALPFRESMRPLLASSDWMIYYPRFLTINLTAPPADGEYRQNYAAYSTFVALQHHLIYYNLTFHC